MDARLEKAAGRNRRRRDIRLRLHAPRTKTPRSSAAINRNSQKSACGGARQNIRANFLDRQKHGRTNRLSRLARRNSERTHLSRLSALRHGRSHEIAGSGSARFKYADFVRSRHARSALPARSAWKGSRANECAEFFAHHRRRGSLAACAQKRSRRRNPGRCRSKNCHSD